MTCGAAEMSAELFRLPVKPRPTLATSTSEEFVLLDPVHLGLELAETELNDSVDVLRESRVPPMDRSEALRYLACAALDLYSADTSASEAFALAECIVGPPPGSAA